MVPANRPDYAGLYDLYHEQEVGMCQTVFDVKSNKKLGTARELADWLGIEPEELQTNDIKPMTESVYGIDWRDCCLCPFNISHTLDITGVWHRRDMAVDSICYLAIKKEDLDVILNREGGTD